MNRLGRLCLAGAVTMVACTVLGAGKTYSGKLVDVVDELNADHPELTIGIDPAILDRSLHLQLQFAVGDDWGADFRTALSTVSLTTVSLKQYPHLLVSTPSALMYYQGLLALESGQFSQAAKAFKAALASEPDHPQVQMLARTAADLVPLQAALLEAGAELTRSIQDRRTEQAVATRLERYQQAFGDLWQTFWADFGHCSSRGLDTELFSLISFASKSCDRYADLLSQCQRRYPALVDEASSKALKALRMRLASDGMTMQGQTQKGQLRVSQGVAMFDDKKHDLAREVFLDAYELNPSDLKCRTYLGWLQAELRLQRREQRAAFIARSRLPPTVDARVGGLADHAERILKAADPHQAALLLALLEGGKLETPLAADQRNRLRQVAVSPTVLPPAGQIDCLVSLGSEFSGAQLTPLLAVVAARQNLDRYHELIVDGIAPESKPYLNVALGQSFGWLDNHAQSSLHNYRIALHFKDPAAAAGGDSLGAPLVVSMFSALYQQPVRPGVVVTGSVRAYGGTAAVGGIPAKVDAAIAAHKLTIVVPHDNAIDLSMLSIDQSRQIRILLAKSIEDYLRHGVVGAIPAAAEETRQQADDLFRVGSLFAGMGMAEQAHATYAKVLSVEPNDYSASAAVAIYEEGKIGKQWPAWLDDLNLSSGGRSAPRGGAAPSLADVTQDVAGQVALHATRCSADPELKPIGAELLEAALAIDPDCREALLLKARLMLGQTVVPPSAESGIRTREDLAALLVGRSLVCAASEEPRLVLLGRLYLSLVLKYFDTENEAALIAFSSAAEGGQSFEIKNLCSQLQGQSETSPGEPTKSESIIASLTPKVVPAVDANILPEEGRISFGAGDPAEAQGADDGIPADAGAGGGFRQCFAETFDGYSAGTTLVSAGWVPYGNSTARLTNGTGFGDKTVALDGSTAAGKGGYTTWHKKFDRAIPFESEVILTCLIYVRSDSGRNQACIGLYTHNDPRPEPDPLGFGLWATENGWYLYAGAEDKALDYLIKTNGPIKTGAYKVAIHVIGKRQMVWAEITPVSGGPKVRSKPLTYGAVQKRPIVGAYIYIKSFPGLPRADFDEIEVKARNG